MGVPSVEVTDSVSVCDDVGVGAVVLCDLELAGIELSVAGCDYVSAWVEVVCDSVCSSECSGYVYS